MLKYSKANAKIEALAQVESLAPYLEGKKKVFSMDLLSGWSCPFAKECLSKVYIVDGKRKIKDGPDTLFRCFSASQEVLFPALYNLRKHNLDVMKGIKGIDNKFARLHADLPKNAGIIRIHVGGDFFNQEYFDAWVKMSDANPNVLFYAYTKSTPYLVKYTWKQRRWENFVITASRGGKKDALIGKHKLREAVVIFEEQTADILDYEIDHDDSHAADPSKRRESFALLIHGTQPAGSEAGQALSKLKGIGSYSRKVKKV